MTRRYVIHGPCIVKVKGSLTSTIPVITELGLCSDAIHITERLYHQDIYIDDFGPNVPAAVLTMGSDCLIRMNLVHYDPVLLSECIALANARIDGVPGKWGKVGTPIFSARRGLGLRLNIIPIRERPYRFFSVHLDGNPLEIPISTERSITSINWRALPNKAADHIEGRGNVGEIRSENAEVYDHGIDLV